MNYTKEVGHHLSAPFAKISDTNSHELVYNIPKTRKLTGFGIAGELSKSTSCSGDCGERGGGVNGLVGCHVDLG